MKYTYNDLINFYKEVGLYDEKKFCLIEKRIRKLPSVDYNFYGVFPKISESGILEDFIISVPNINDLDDLLVNIHEYAHGLILISNINKSFIKNDLEEVLPKTLERIYLNKNANLDDINKYNKRDFEYFLKTNSLSHKKAILLQFMIAKDYEDVGIIDIPLNYKTTDDINLAKKLLYTFK